MQRTSLYLSNVPCLAERTIFNYGPQPQQIQQAGGRHGGNTDFRFQPLPPPQAEEITVGKAQTTRILTYHTFP